MKTEKEIRERYEYKLNRHREFKKAQIEEGYHYSGEWRAIKELELLEWVLGIKR